MNVKRKKLKAGQFGRQTRRQAAGKSEALKSLVIIMHNMITKL